MKSWENYLKKLDKEFGRATIDKWLRAMRVINFDARNLYLEASNSFQLLWYNEHIKDRISGELQSNGRPIKVHIRQIDKQEKKVKVEERPEFPPCTLSKEADFAHFMVHKGAEIAYKLLKSLDFATFNPVVIYGPKGSGKSHLLQAAGSALVTKGTNVYYITAEKFTQHVVRAMRTGEMIPFRQAVRSADAFIVDGVDELAHRLATQEEFFHTFNTFHMAGKPVILSMSIAPQNLEGIEPRLVSRFEWGISLPIAPPANLTPLLKKLLTDQPFSIDEPGQEFLLSTFTSPHFLSDAIETLTYHASLRGCKFYTRDALLTPLTDLMAKERKSTLTPEKIVDEVAKTSGKPREEILGKSRQKELVLPRQVAMYLIRKRLNLSYTKIGHFFHRDHSTIMNAVAKIEDGLATKDPTVTVLIANLK